MARVTVEDCLREVNSRFALVHLAVQRVLQHRKGHPPLVEAPKNKEVVRALREIAAGLVTRENLHELDAGPDYQEVKDLPVEEADSGEVETAVQEVEESEQPTESSEPSTAAD